MGGKNLTSQTTSGVVNTCTGYKLAWAKQVNNQQTREYWIPMKTRISHHKLIIFWWSRGCPLHLGRPQPPTWGPVRWCGVRSAGSLPRRNAAPFGAAASPVAPRTPKNIIKIFDDHFCSLIAPWSTYLFWSIKTASIGHPSWISDYEPNLYRLWNISMH